MTKNILTLMTGVALSLLLSACVAKQTPMVIDPGTVPPGSQITRKGKPLSLVGTPIAVGQRLPATSLVDAETMETVDFDGYQGSVLLLSIVPSLDTKVCEEQTHYLGEKGDKLPPTVKRLTVSRDTPFAQLRFAKEAKLTDIQYLSDYKEGAFGRATGLLIDGLMLLARSIVIVDTEGIVQYIQVVPEITNLPDMETAFAKAVELAAQPGS